MNCIISLVHKATIWSISSQPCTGTTHSIIAKLRSDQLVPLVCSQGQDPTDSVLNFHLLRRWIYSHEVELANFSQSHLEGFNLLSRLDQVSTYGPETLQSTIGLPSFWLLLEYTYCKKVPNCYCEDNCSMTTAMTATTMIMVRKTKRLDINLLFKSSKLSAWNRMQIFI